MCRFRLRRLPGPGKRIGLSQVSSCCRTARESNATEKRMAVSVEDLAQFWPGHYVIADQQKAVASISRSGAEPAHLGEDIPKQAQQV